MCGGANYVMMHLFVYISIKKQKDQKWLPLLPSFQGCKEQRILVYSQFFKTW